MTDSYACTAEYYQLMSEPYWDVLRPVLADALAEVDPATGPVVDVGAGTGLSTLVAAHTLPQARIVAVEPSPSMRTVLLTRVAADADLRRRVTVLPLPLSEAALPERVCAVIAIGVLHHFDAAGRREFMKVLADRLAPRALAVVEVQDPPEVCTVPSQRYHMTTVGDVTYEGWMSARPKDQTAMEWTMTYRAVRDGETLDDRSVRFTMFPVSPATVVSEATAAGLAARELGHGLVELRQPDAAAG
ncbi:class I SAM-dependent methyltransferase [Microbispora sp. CA-102843]|uniref:class I SAM-dependent methyltransferase n=1 Tax=Microbispora sp. CA-102843 TaxID=3239952 RepID=UPI003D8C3CDA